MLTPQEISLLKILSDGQYHSGEAIGEQLGISRTGVWKVINQLGEYGLFCDRLHGQGYCIPGGIEFLDKDKIQGLLAPNIRLMLTQIACHLTIGSTNGDLVEKIKSGAEPVLVSIAEHQSAGRGRRGRQWLSPFGQNVCLSFSWSFYNGPAVTQGLTLAIGIGLLQVLESFGIPDLGLKWPNDILWQGKKLAGVLTEMHIDSLGVCHVVVGIGVNFSLPYKVKSEIGQASVSLQEVLGKGVSRNELVAKILNHLLNHVKDFDHAGFGAFEKPWDRYDILKNKPIRLHTMLGEIEGIAAGVDKLGGLKVRRNGDLEIYHSGEVSVRFKEDVDALID